MIEIRIDAAPIGMDMVSFADLEMVLESGGTNPVIISSIVGYLKPIVLSRCLTTYSAHDHLCFTWWNVASGTGSLGVSLRQ